MFADIDECASSPCQNGGSCVDQANAYTCNCSAGYTGDHCQNDTDECASSPCQNGGSCVDQVNAYTCNCSAGYNGSHCETDTDECASSPCQNGGSCVDQVNAYTCNCPAGYNGSHCETDIDECESNPCPNGEDCEDTVNGYNCCPPGYSGTTCNESWLKATCTTAADCTKYQTGCYSGHCLCKDGYFFSHSQAACVQTCDLLDTNYLYYKDTDLTGTTHVQISTPDSTTCAAQCSTDPQCITFIIFQGTCYMKSFTGQGSEGSWQAKVGARMYQRTCE
ncbi:fibropellin-3-like [Littorina saxatilis]|uniref:fibropellin-3-like n=1 Tax=Littorina saxatilis TaxID=31220 RepID=UPI0038B4486C